MKGRILNSLRRPEIHVTKVRFNRTRSFSFLKSTTCTLLREDLLPQLQRREVKRGGQIMLRDQSWQLSAVE